MSTNISIILLVLYIYPVSILLLYELINFISTTVYLFKLIAIIRDELLVISLVKVKKSKVHYAVLF